MTSSMKARRKPRLKKATIPWLCGGGGSEVDVVLPERYTPPRPPGKTRIKADVQESRLSRSATTSTSANRAGRNKGTRQHAGEARPETRVGHGDGLLDDANEEEYQKQRQKQQGNGLPGFRRRRSSDPAQLRHYLNWESQPLRRSSSSTGRRGPSRRSRSIDASASIQRLQEKHAPDNNRTVNPSFNLGMGAAFLFLLSRGATEFQKIVELRKDAEALLAKIQDAVARLETISPVHRTAAQSFRDTGGADAVKPRVSATTLSSSSSTVNKEMIAADCFFPESTSASPVLSCHSFKMPHHTDDACSISGTAADSQARMMEQLEAELQSELLRLEFTLGANEDPQDPVVLQEFMNQADFMREYAVMPWSKGIKYEPSSLLRENSEEEDDMHDHHQYTGVCPYTLERRLRDLLETRQLDGVEYPEYTLQSPEGGIQDAEMEIPRWRNEARLPCQLAPPVVGH